MHFTRPTISTQRLQRFHRWALLWLTWFAAFLDAAAAYSPLSRQAKTLAHAYLDQIQRLIVVMVMIRAAAHVRQPARRQTFSEHQRKERGFERALLGVKLWRDLRHRDLRQRIAALRQDMYTLVKHVLRRAPRGLTRRRPIRARPDLRAADPRETILAPARSADTS